MRIAAVAVVAVLALAGLALAFAGRGEDERSATAARDATPALYTNANSREVWQEPKDHLGARVDVTGRVIGSRKVRGGRVVAMRLSGQDVAVHVFDRRFAAEPGERLRVVGEVRGPLGAKSVPGVKAFGSLERGAAVIDAAAASRG